MKPTHWLGVGLLVFLGALSVAHSQQITNPSIVADGCAYNSSPPSITSGQFALVQCDSTGNVRVTGTTTPSGTASNAADGVATSTNNLSTVNYPFLWNGATFDRWKGDATNGAFVNVKVLPALVAGTAIIGNVRIDQTTPGTTNGVQVNAALPAGTNLLGKTSIDQTTPGTTNGVQINAAIPAGANLIGKTGIDQTTPGTTNGVQITATTAVAPVVSASVESNHVLKGSAGSLLSVSTTAGATAGFMLIFDATSAPVDGAVTPKYCIQVPANNFSSASWPTPATFATGITVVFSTTGCFTKTASATAFFSGQVQ